MWGSCSSRTARRPRRCATASYPRAAADGALIAATHMPFPGLGRIVSDRGQLRWQTADWALQS